MYPNSDPLKYKNNETDRATTDSSVVAPACISKFPLSIETNEVLSKPSKIDKL